MTISKIIQSLNMDGFLNQYLHADLKSIPQPYCQDTDKVNAFVFGADPSNFLIPA